MKKLTGYLADKKVYLLVNPLVIFLFSVLWMIFLRQYSVLYVFALVGVTTGVSLFFVYRQVGSERFNPVSDKAWEPVKLSHYWRPLGKVIRLNLLGGFELGLLITIFELIMGNALFIAGNPVLVFWNVLIMVMFAGFYPVIWMLFIYGFYMITLWIGVFRKKQSAFDWTVLLFNSVIILAFMLAIAGIIISYLG